MPEGAFDSRAYAVSADGKTVVGTGNGKFGREGFVWTAKGGLRSIGNLRPISCYSEARAVTPDGSAVVGFSRDAYGQVAVRWTEKEGLVSLGRLPGAGDSEAVGVTGHDQVIGNSLGPKQKLTYQTVGVSRLGPTSASARSAVKSLPLGGLVGWMRTERAFRQFVPGVDAVDFHMVGGITNSDTSWVEYDLGSGKRDLKLTFEGDYQLIGCTTLGDVVLTGISASGDRVCGAFATHSRVPDLSSFVEYSNGEKRYGELTARGTVGFCQIGEVVLPLATETTPKRRMASVANPTAISANGTVVVGYQGNDVDCMVAVWHLLPTRSVLSIGWVGPDSGAENSYRGGDERYSKAKAWAVSSTGEVVVGERFQNPGVVSSVPLPWISSAIVLAKGCDRWIILEDLLKVYCPKELDGWKLQSVRGVSADGKTLVGYGLNPQGKTEAWIATLGDVRKPLEKLMNPQKPADDDSEE